MKLFVCGVEFKNEARHHSPREKTEALARLLPGIARAAETDMGAGAMVLIVLHEYALTENAVNAGEKNILLRMLQKVLNRHPNLFLVPGSLAYYHSHKDKKDKQLARIKKIARNYAANELLLAEDSYTQEEFQNFTSAIKNNSPVTIAHNSTFLLHKDKNNKIKRNKSTPYNELGKLAANDKKKSYPNPIFYLGADEPLQTIVFNDQLLKIALFICREFYFFTPSTNLYFNFNPPAIEVIVCDSVNPLRDIFFGAVTVFMDSHHGLHVDINTLHPDASQFEEVQAIKLTIEKVGNRLYPVKEEQINIVIDGDDIKDPNHPMAGPSPTLSDSSSSVAISQYPGTLFQQVSLELEKEAFNLQPSNPLSINPGIG